MKYTILSSFVFLICCLTMPGCDQGSTPVPANLDGFELVQIKGSDTQKAVKKDGGGTVVEEGYVLNGNKHGLWMTYHPDGRIATINHYVDGNLNGVSLTLDNRGQITDKAFFTDNQYDGQKAKYRFGRPQEIVPYKNGVIDGRVVKYYTNTKVMEEIDYANGKQHGYYRHYNEEGVMDLEYVYENGTKVSGGIVTPDQE